MIRAPTHLRIVTLLVIATFTPVAAGRDKRTDQPPGARATATTRPMAPVPPQFEGCTMIVPALHASVEVRMPFASDFCEIVSRALAGDVFHAPVTVLPGKLWHYADAVRSCRLRFRHTRYRLSIRNAVPACRWFTRPITGWHREATGMSYAP
jgi:hypothetical protein